MNSSCDATGRHWSDARRFALRVWATARRTSPGQQASVPVGVVDHVLEVVDAGRTQRTGDADYRVARSDLEKRLARERSELVRDAGRLCTSRHFRSSRRGRTAIPLDRASEAAFENRSRAAKRPKLDVEDRRRREPLGRAKQAARGGGKEGERHIRGNAWMPAVRRPRYSLRGGPRRFESAIPPSTTSQRCPRKASQRGDQHEIGERSPAPIKTQTQKG